MRAQKIDFSDRLSNLKREYDSLKKSEAYQQTKNQRMNQENLDMYQKSIASIHGKL